MLKIAGSSGLVGRSAGAHMRWISLSLLAAASLLSAVGCSNSNVKAAAPPPPPVVEVAPVIQRDVPVQGQWVGTLDGYVNAQISPQVSGYLIRQDYQEGALVKKGQVLFEIDPRPFQAVLDQAKGQLAQAEAQMANAQINVNRDIPEAEAHAIPQSQLDNDTQSLLAAKAAVQAYQAAVEQASINLGYTKVLSLIDGIAGITTVQVGNLVGPSTVLTAVSQVSPIKVYFPISEQEYSAHGGWRRSGDCGLADSCFTNPVEVDPGRWEYVPASRQNHLRGSAGKHADGNHSDRGRVSQLQKSVATRPVCARSGANRKY
jgi:multidrug efflux pump subunit AcrA (membrane-fusion protein)